MKPPPAPRRNLPLANFGPYLLTTDLGDGIARVIDYLGPAIPHGTSPTSARLPPAAVDQLAMRADRARVRVAIVRLMFNARVFRVIADLRRP